MTTWRRERRTGWRTAALVLAMTCMCATATTALAAALEVGRAGDKRRTVVVPHQDPKTSPMFRVRPRSLTLPPLNESADAGVSARKLRWRGWGKPTAVGRGTIRVGDPDNGYIYLRGQVRLSRIDRTNCGDLPPRPMYGRARVIGVRKALGVNSVVFAPLLRC